MTERIEEHPALNNAFYEIWMSRRLYIGELEIFARNYGEWVKSFPDTLAVLFNELDDPAAKEEIASTLYSERGYDRHEKVHWILLDNFLSELATKPGVKGTLDRKGLKERLQEVNRNG